MFSLRYSLVADEGNFITQGEEVKANPECGIRSAEYEKRDPKEIRATGKDSFRIRMAG
jgi:hypothetical protein